MNSRLRRRILALGSRRVHYSTGGRGAAVILLHGSPGNAWLVRPLAERLLPYFSVYAIDTPGFGGSDALPDRVESVAQLADGYREILDALGLERVLVYGTHSGAAIGLELAHRHAERVVGFVLEGVPAFTEEEQRPLLAPDYLVALEPEALGGHYARAWTRFHDQFVWFPWYSRTPAHLNEADAGSAADIHLWVEMYFQALRHDYRPAYQAVIRYGSDALTAAAAVRVPGIFLAEKSDMLFPHLDRLPPLHEGQRIERVAVSAELPARIESALRSLPVPGPRVQARAEARIPAATPPRDVPSEDFFDLPGGELFVRSGGEGEGTPILLLHDAPGAGRQLLGLLHALARHRPVMLPDLPGCGESDPLPADAHTLAEYADAMALMLRARAGGPVRVHAVGFGAAVALELNARHPDLVAALSITGLLRLTGAARAALIGRLAPPIALADDGSHWYRTWLMLRDSLVRWPWYERAATALRRQAVAFDAGQLHDWTCDVMRQWHAYHRLIDAVLEWHPDGAVALARPKLSIAVDARHALHAADVEWAASGVPAVTLPEHAQEQAMLLAALDLRSARASE
jgi:pimeloyl-ACP methyl ester carboxylesterase